LLAIELGKDSNSPEVRKQAGIIIKSSLSSKDNQQQILKGQRWISFPGELRTHIKNLVLFICFEGYFFFFRHMEL
jgi:hypothetical protein